MAHPSLERKMKGQQTSRAKLSGTISCRWIWAVREWDDSIWVSWRAILFYFFSCVCVCVLWLLIDWNDGVCLCMTVTEWEGTHLELNKVSRYDMAAYLCIASNGVPPTVSKRISLSVECKSVLFVYYKFEYLNVCFFKFKCSPIVLWDDCVRLWCQ